MARGESAGSRFSENFLGGLQTGYDIGERYQKRKREKAVQATQEEVYSQPLMTREQIMAGRDKLRAAYAANGTPEDIAKVDEQFNGMISQKLSEGLKSARALISAGEYDKGSQALSSAYSLLPTGSQLQVVAQPPDANGQVQFLLRGVDEQTGESTGQGRMLDDKKLNLLLAGFEATAPELAKLYIDNADKESQITTRAEGVRQGDVQLDQGQQGLGLRQQEITQTGQIAQANIGLGYAGLKARAQEGALDRASAEGRAAADRDLSVKLQGMRDVMDMYQTDVSAAGVRAGQAIQKDQLGLEQTKFDADRAGREANVLYTEAQTEKARLSGIGQWDQDSLGAAETRIGGVIKTIIDNAGLDAEDAPVDVATLQANSLEIMSSNQPGTVGSAEAVKLVFDMDPTNPKGRPGDFVYRTGAPGGMVKVTDKKTGQQFLLPESTVAKITGQPAQAPAPAAAPAATPATAQPAPRQAVPTAPPPATGQAPAVPAGPAGAISPVASPRDPRRAIILPPENTGGVTGRY